jgi:hypothetical protein
MQTVQEIHNCSSVIDTAESGMRRTKEHGKLRLLILSAATCGLLMTVFLARVAHAQQSAAKPADSQKTGSAKVSPVGQAVTGEVAEETAKPGKPRGEGFKVHGHWVLVVKNPDGKVVDRREFDNSLVTGGAALSGDAILAAVLSGNASVGDPVIMLIDGAINGAGVDPSTVCYLDSAAGVPVTCSALSTGQQPVTQLTAPETSPSTWQTGLVSTANFTTANSLPSVSWVLSGNFTVPSTFTTLNAVQSLLPLCLALNGPPPTTTPGTVVQTLFGHIQGRTADVASKSCAVAISDTPNGEFVMYGALTSTTINNGGTAAPITGLTAGQIIMISVTITFS